MDSIPKVSILIPIYNVEAYLVQCLESAIHQRIQDIEIICINDGSTDNSLNILKEYAKNDFRIKIIDKKNSGYGHSMNLALQMAKGEYIGIIESDDFASENMFSELYKMAKQSKADIVKSNCWCYQQNKDEYFEFLKGCPYDICFNAYDYQQIFYCQILIWSAIYKRKFLLENDIWFNETPGASYQDISFSFKAFACAKNIFLLKDAFMHYRNDNPDSSIHSKEKIYCVCDEYDEIHHFLDMRNDLREKYIFLLENLQYRAYVWNYERVNKKYKIEFFIRMLCDFQRDEDKGFFRKRYWNNEEWETVQGYIASKQQALYKRWNYFQDYNMCLYAFRGVFSESKKVFIYGAGQIGKLVAKYFINHDLIIDGFLVSDMARNSSVELGFKVNEFGKIPLDRESTIFIAVKESNQSEILYKLMKAGFKKVILITADMRENVSKL